LRQNISEGYNNNNNNNNILPFHSAVRKSEIPTLTWWALRAVS
jgi:hypothetical protein